MKKRSLMIVLSLFLFLPVAFAQQAEEPKLTYTEPYMVTLNPDKEMNILWLTKEKCEGYVEYGLTPTLGSKTAAQPYEIDGMRTSVTAEGYDADPAKNPAIAVYQLIAKLENLEPGKVYYYRATTKVGDKVQTGKRYFFKTAPQKGEAFDFALLSDMQLKVKTKETLHFLGQQQKDFLIFAGDLSNTPWKVGEWFDVEGCFQKKGEEDRAFFTCLSQDNDNCRLMQYMPIFYTPGNHEVDDQRVCTDKEIAKNPDNWNWSIYMQLFRPLYPEQQYKVGGKHWYSVNYGDLHLSAINVHRWQSWGGFEAPGWFTYDDIGPDSDQAKWLEADLSSDQSKYKWVVMHWHMLNRGEDGWIPVSKAVADPGNPENVVYPDGDYCWDVLRPMYEAYKVDAVNFGHSHVYERYLINGVNYIEAASIGNNYRSANDPYHPSGNHPIEENNLFRSIMMVHVGKEGMVAEGIQASVENNGVGYIGRVFDRFTIAK